LKRGFKTKSVVYLALSTRGICACNVIQYIRTFAIFKYYATRTSNICIPAY